jgi:hypothetical protein
MWYSLLLLGYKPVQNVTVLNTVGICNTTVSTVKPVLNGISRDQNIFSAKARFSFNLLAPEFSFKF